MKKAFRSAYLALLLLFLYAPIVVLIAYSFNASKSRAVWEGFSLKWYMELFRNRDVLRALYVTLVVALLAAVFSTLLGTLAAIGMHAMKKRWSLLYTNLTYLPMVTPDIVTGVSLMLLFVFSSVPRGMVTMLLAHIVFDTPYVIFSVLPKLRQMNNSVYEAALDLGATPSLALRKVVLPEIMPGVVTGALLAFTLSLDDFVISYFTSAKAVNLSIYIYSAARRGINPMINALSALMFVCVLTLLLVVNRRKPLLET